MKTNSHLSLLIILFVFFNYDIYSQSIDFHCGSAANPYANNSTGNPFEGLYKPNRTDTLNGNPLPSEAFLPVLVVFVQFKNEGDDPWHTWNANSPPVYLSNLIATQKRTSGDWWNYYNENTEILSDQWMETSRGKLHVVSPSPTGTGAFSVILSQEASYYAAFGSQQAELLINSEIWRNLDSQGVNDWRPYDRWKKDSTGFVYTPFGEGDGLVDMIFKVHKSRNNGGLPNNAGYPFLSVNNRDSVFLVDTVNSIKINYGYGHEGSGLTVSFRAQLAQYLGTLGHEFGHYLISGSHSTYSRVSYGFGYDYFYSPADMILNNYMTPRNCTMNSTNGLYDYSSRNSGSGEILKVPIHGNEYFLLVSRNKVSKWDRVMIGDSAQVDTYGDNSESGKGLYIYHVPNGIEIPGNDISQQDMECADGLFEFEYGGQSAQQVIYDCFISGANDWYYYKKKKVLYENDSSNLDRHQPTFAFRLKGDGISFRPYLGIINGDYAYGLKWWGEGDHPSSNCEIGTDRIFTNKKEIYTNFEVGGDRWDAWKPGYNEVFSPYSSPNTNTWSDSNSGIFIWHYDYSGSGPAGLAYMKIYKAGVGEPLSLDSVLHLTPPSRPMGIVVDYYLESEDYRRPIITWNHNKEPDMLISDTITKKRYKIWRAFESSMAGVPTNYTLLKTLDIDSGTAPSYIDTSIIGYGSVYPGTGGQMEYPIRYRVQAIDKWGDSSVRSDFGSAIGLLNCGYACAMGEDNIANNEDLPKVYSIDQNYPNPFNPSTNIKYEIPQDNFVSIKIYNLLGKEVMNLINDFKKAGRYDISFNGSNLASGVYYYKIKAGEFVQIRKMVLIK